MDSVTNIFTPMIALTPLFMVGIAMECSQTSDPLDTFVPSSVGNRNFILPMEPAEPSGLAYMESRNFILPFAPEVDQ